MKTTSESAPDADVYQQFLELCPLLGDGRCYLASRAISEETTKIFRVGQLNDGKAILASIIEAFGYSRVEKAGLLAKSSIPVNSRLVFRERSLVFPFLESDRIAYLQTRTFGQTKKYGNLNHRQRRIYNVDALKASEAHSIAICEGVIDTLSAKELGFNAIGLLGVTALLAKNQIQQLRGKEVDILLDWDDQGETRATKLQDELNKYGIVSTRKARPSKHATDINEYLMEIRGLA